MIQRRAIDIVIEIAIIFVATSGCMASNSVGTDQTPDNHASLGETGFVIDVPDGYVLDELFAGESGLATYCVRQPNDGLDVCRDGGVAIVLNIIPDDYELPRNHPVSSSNFVEVLADLRNDYESTSSQILNAEVSSDGMRLGFEVMILDDHLKQIGAVKDGAGGAIILAGGNSYAESDFQSARALFSQVLASISFNDSAAAQ